MTGPKSKPWGRACWQVGQSLRDAADEMTRDGKSMVGVLAPEASLHLRDSDQCVPGICGWVAAADQVEKLSRMEVEEGRGEEGGFGLGGSDGLLLGDDLLLGGRWGAATGRGMMEDPPVRVGQPPAG